jgi:hypothetical protein
VTDVVDTTATARPDLTARIYKPDPQTTVLPLGALPFYADYRGALRPGEPPILDNRPVLISRDRPASLADTPAPEPTDLADETTALAEILTEPAAEHPIVPAAARSRRDGDPGRHRAADPAWLWWMVAGGALLATSSVTTLIVLAVAR